MRFPDITVLVSEGGHPVAAQLPNGSWPTPTRLMIFKVHFINGDANRNVCIREAYLRAKTNPGSPWGYWQIFGAPTRPVEYDNPVQALEFPLNLAPRAGAGGYLVFELPDSLSSDLAPSPGEFSVEITEALSGKRAAFPAPVVGAVFRTQRGLVPTTSAERVTGPPVVYWRGSPWEGLRSCARCGKRPGQHEAPWPSGQALLCKHCCRAVNREAVKASQQLGPRARIRAVAPCA
jgi:hypothetical protein